MLRCSRSPGVDKGRTLYGWEVFLNLRMTGDKHFGKPLSGGRLEGHFGRSESTICVYLWLPPFADSQEERRRKGERARQLIRERFQWSQIARTPGDR